MITLMKLCSLQHKCQTKVQYSTYILFLLFCQESILKWNQPKQTAAKNFFQYYEQSAFNIYQVVGLPLEKRKKRKKVLCLDTRSHMQNAKRYLLLHHPLCCTGKFLLHQKHLHPIQRMRDQPSVSIRQQWHSSQDKQVIFFSLQHFMMALFPTIAYLPATSDSVSNFEPNKSELRYYLILYIFRTRSIVILFLEPKKFEQDKLRQSVQDVFISFACVLAQMSSPTSPFQY